MVSSHVLRLVPLLLTLLLLVSGEGGTVGVGGASGAAAGGGAPAGDDFLARYLATLEPLLHDALGGAQQQQAALSAAARAYQLAGGGAPAGGWGPVPWGSDVWGWGGVDSAYAGGAVGPAGFQQLALISPPNPAQPNVDVSSRFKEDEQGADRDAGSSGGAGNFYSVSTSSQVSSMDVDGKKTSNRQASTVINDNGKIHKHSVSS